jgi:tetratricopeptide (TPR) repeat protein
MKKSAVAAAVFLLAAGVALASWYDDYDAGLNAIRKGQWAVAVQRMSAAINANGTENDRARTYGNIFISYHPYYYRGVANLNLGRYEAAIHDFEQARGVGEVDQGSIETLMQRARTKLDASQTPPPQPQPQPVVPTPQPRPPQPQPVVPTPQPVVPSIDPALRQRARAAIDDAKRHLDAAKNRRAAGTLPYNDAVKAIADANTRAALAKSNDDLNAAIALAGNATLMADAAQPPNVPQPQPPTRNERAGRLILAETNKLVHRALTNYFDGEFEAASSDFTRLTQEMPNNAWVWAFLGASQYSQYAFEADEKYRMSAMESFRQAKRLRKWKDGLPSRYFSRRIRRVFDSAG